MRKVGGESWLAEPDMDHQVSANLRSAEDYIFNKGPDARSKAISKLAGPWARPNLHVDVPRLHLQPLVALEHVMAAKKAAEEARKAVDEAQEKAQVKASEPRLGEAW